MCVLKKSRSTYQTHISEDHKVDIQIIIIQSNLIISNSLISNYRLSRSENLVPVLA